MSIKVIEAESFLEAGQIQAKCFKQELNAFYKNLKNLSIVNQIKPKFIPFNLSHRVLKYHSTKAILPKIKEYAPLNYEFLLGMSKYAGIDLKDLLLIASANVYLMRSIYYSRKILTKNLQVNMSENGDFCSYLWASDELAKSSIVMKNLDYMTDLQNHVFIRKLKVGTKEIVSPALFSMPQLTDGMNDSGIVMSLNNAYSLEKPSNGIPISMAMTEALYNSDSLSEALNFLLKVPIANSGIINISDAHNNHIAIEISYKKKIVGESKSRNFIAYTNFYQSEELQEYDRRHYVKTRGAAAWELDKKWLESAELRLKRLNALANKTTEIDYKILAKISKDCGNSNIPTHKTIFMKGINSTLASSIYDSKNLLAYISLGNQKGFTKVKV